ncbi:MAG TPA: FdhF/YdeP family oxidoreductase, partial [Spongiibacteraceae bacterium]|nr:FdhF/YdeP family oxidoreductase [Spongiibacteraceae bacterium]
TNQPRGFDCLGCAWGETPEAGRVDFCENGVKAVAWETTRDLVDAAFFARHSVDALRQRDGHWLESQGRLAQPMHLAPGASHYRPISWEDAYALIASHLRALPDPNQALFYTSGRTSNEAAFLYQLMVRLYGTNNFPDCSNMCHEASGVALSETLGVGKGTVRMEDFELTDAIFVIGQNPGTNHPRMLATLADAAKRGATIVAVNPLRERGLQRFANPQKPRDMLLASSSAISRHYLTPRLGGDMALIRGMAKYLFAWDAQRRRKYQPALLDDVFIGAHTQGIDAYRAQVEATDWAQIIEQSGLARDDIELAARIYAGNERVIITWAMGLTQHQHSVATIQEISNLLLLRGNIGRPGAGACPVRGHSNVQGDRTMGINEAPDAAFLDRLGAVFGFEPPRAPGHNTVQAIQAMERGDARVFIAMGGNFAAATPDTARTERALQGCALTVQISTKLNRSHLMTGREALILPCLGRSDRDRQASGEQFITVEDSMSMVHASQGVVAPASAELRSEPAIVAGMAQALLGDRPVDWGWYIADYDRIRDAIAAVLPAFADFNARVRRPRGFYLGNSAARREWHTAGGRARFMAHPLPAQLPRQRAQAHSDQPLLTLQTLRSHDQYNTTVYGMDDRYRGIYGQRRVLMMNPADIAAHGLQDGDLVDIHSINDDAIARSVHGFRVVAYDTPSGCCAAYYPETNALVALDSCGDRSFTPASKAVVVRVVKAAEDAGRETEDAGRKGDAR